MSNVTRTQPCAEPSCPRTVGPRHPQTAFIYLHCEEHRTEHSDELRGGLPWRAKWSRRTCDHCGAIFEKYATNGGGNSTGRFFCSSDCRNAAGTKPRRGETRNCETCGGEFYVRANSAQRFCKRTCKDIGGRSAVYLDFTCKQCGASFQVTESLAKYNKNEFCTIKCRQDYRKPAPGDRKLTSDGYVTIYAPDHPMAQPSTGWAMEHRVVISDILGRPLLPSEEVHHRSGVRTENRPDQLVLMSTSHPAGAGLRDTLDWCRRFIVENEAVAEKLEAAGVHTSLDGDDAVVPLLGSEA